LKTEKKKKIKTKKLIKNNLIFLVFFSFENLKGEKKNFYNAFRLGPRLTSLNPHPPPPS
jgi:hypothetical protein